MVWVVCFSYANGRITVSLQIYGSYDNSSQTLKDISQLLCVIIKYHVGFEREIKGTATKSVLSNRLSIF